MTGPKMSDRQCVSPPKTSLGCVRSKSTSYRPQSSRRSNDPGAKKAGVRAGTPALILPSSGAALHAAQKINKDRRQQPLLGVPILQRDVEVGMILGHHLVILGVRHQAMGNLAGLAQVCPIISRDYAGGHRH